MGVGPTTTLDESRERLNRMLAFQRDHGFTFWAVTHAETGELLGDCGLIPLEGVGPEVELGYRFGSAHWGKGYATEAARACRDLGFERFRLPRGVSITSPSKMSFSGTESTLRTVPTCSPSVVNTGVPRLSAW